MDHLVRRNASVGNVDVAAATMRREDDEVCCLIDDGPCKTPADITIPKDQASDSDALICHAAADSIEILLRDAFVTANETLSQFESFGLQRPNLCQLWYRHHVNQDNFSLVCLCQSNGERKGALGAGRSVQRHEDPAISNDLLVTNGMWHEQEWAGSPIDDPAGCAAEIPTRGITFSVGAEDGKIDGIVARPLTDLFGCLAFDDLCFDAF